jgi:hypothetical protein
LQPKLPDWYGALPTNGSWLQPQFGRFLELME